MTIAALFPLATIFALSVHVGSAFYDHGPFRWYIVPVALGVSFADALRCDALTEEWVERQRRAHASRKMGSDALDFLYFLHETLLVFFLLQYFFWRNNFSLVW